MIHDRERNHHGEITPHVITSTPQHFLKFLSRKKEHNLVVPSDFVDDCVLWYKIWNNINEISKRCIVVLRLLPSFSSHHHRHLFIFHLIYCYCCCCIISIIIIIQKKRRGVICYYFHCCWLMILFTFRAIQQADAPFSCRRS